MSLNPLKSLRYSANNRAPAVTCPSSLSAPSSRAVNICVTSSSHIFTTASRRWKVGELPFAWVGVLPPCVTDGSEPVQDPCWSAAVEKVKEKKELQCFIKEGRSLSLSAEVSASTTTAGAAPWHNEDSLIFNYYPSCYCWNRVPWVQHSFIGDTEPRAQKTSGRILSGAIVCRAPRVVFPPLDLRPSQPKAKIARK